MSRTLIEAARLAVMLLAAGGAGWWARETTLARRFRRIAESVQAERMEP